MRFEEKLKVDLNRLERFLRVGPGQGGQAVAIWAHEAVQALEQAAEPRWAYAVFPLETAANTPVPGGLHLPGESIQAHLAGCEQCVFLGLTLGDGADRAIRAAEAADMAKAVVMDAAASVLAEQYANEAARLLAGHMAPLYLTSRFSPGYGDLPLSVQGEFLRLLDGPRAIGLAATPGGLLTPRKSITAVVGAAGHPVQGAQAGCEACSLRHSCDKNKECSTYAGQPF